MAKLIKAPSVGQILHFSDFRCRHDEVDATIATVPLRELLSVAEPRTEINRAIRRAQTEALLRLVPGTVAAQVIAAALVMIALTGEVALHWLGGWFGSILVVCIARGLRAWRLRADAAYAARKPAKVAAILAVVAILATLWLVPPLLFFGNATKTDQLLLLFLTMGLLSAGSYTLSTLPAVAVTYIWLLAVGGIVMCLRLGETALAVLAPIYAVVMSGAVISHARQFINHVRSRLQLQEQGELVKLLQEFQASGSGGIWELDADTRITNISDGLARAIGMPVVDIVGRTMRELLDPLGRIAELSSGMRTLFDHFENAVEFRDLAVPAFESTRWWTLSGKPLFDDSGRVIGWRGVGSDITGLRLSGEDAVRAARTDPLTGLANRLLVRELLEEALLSQLDGERGCALLLVDLDRFKLVNDTLGHAIGDQLLAGVARRLEAVVGDGGRLGRLGGDEFAIVWTGPSDRETLGRLAEQIAQELSRCYPIGTANLHIGATIGIACGPEAGRREEQLMRSADLALYRAKEEGRGGYAFYEHHMFVAAEDHRLIENGVREALEGNGLKLVYQQIIDSESGQEAGREALLRWRHPTRGDIPPDLFVPIIEDAGLIHQIGDWVIHEACAKAAAWDETLRVAVNVSATQLAEPRLAQTVLSALATSGLSPSRLELEVTETVFLGDDAATIASLDRLRSLGVRLVLDDFGKGYSSFGYLSRAHFSKIKIDQTFVRGAAQGVRENVAIVHAILALARGLGLETTAEGVETAEQADAMRRLGCTQLQGFYFGRPVPEEELRRWLAPPIGAESARQSA